MAQLSPEAKALLNAQKERLLELIDRAKFLEFTIFDNFGDSSALLKLTNEAITHTQNRIPALFRSLEEIQLDWRLN